MRLIQVSLNNAGLRSRFCLALRRDAPLPALGGPVSRRKGALLRRGALVKRRNGALRARYAPLQRRYGPLHARYAPTQQRYGVLPVHDAPVQRHDGGVHARKSPVRRVRAPVRSARGVLRSVAVPVFRVAAPVFRVATSLPPSVAGALRSAKAVRRVAVSQLPRGGEVRRALEVVTRVEAAVPRAPAARSCVAHSGRRVAEVARRERGEESRINRPLSGRATEAGRCPARPRPGCGPRRPSSAGHDGGSSGPAHSREPSKCRRG